ncbi:MAG: hypothetical protein S4CHLAM102_07750 [Chlamydiia bacterium]|nr:hypothetical protein [Chlamydiia bacterium]
MSALITLGAGAFAVVYGASTACASAGTILAMNRAKGALDAKLPQNPGDRVYGTIVCDEQNAKIYEALRDHPVLYGRVKVYEENFRVTPGLGYGKQGLVVTLSDVNESRNYKVPIPRTPTLSSPQGPVTCHRLHAAQWCGFFEQEDSLSPTGADETLAKLNIPTNYDCDGYEIRRQWFDKDENVTIFGDITKTENGFAVHPPSGRRPYIATASKGHEHVHSEKSDAKKQMGIGIGSIGLGLGIWKWSFSH